LFRRRNFNIDSLTVGRTNVSGVSRMTIVVGAGEREANLVQTNLRKLVNVINVYDVTHERAVIRDLALIKVRADTVARAEINQIAEIFRAKIVDVSHTSLIVEVTGTEEKIDSLLKLLEPFGIIEMVRTGRVAMARGDDGMPAVNGRRPALKSVA
jgi:acetolactate synthase-1/3 small subunit